MKTVHLINDFNSSFYLDLFSNFNSNNHIVLSSYRVSKHRLNLEYQNINVVHKYIKKRIFVLQYFFVIRRLLKKTHIIIHTHSSSYEGILALMCKFFFGIEYIYTIRNTDVSKTITSKLGRIFFDYLILESKYVVIKSKTYTRFIPEEYKHKIKFIPNGLNQFWINNFIDSKTSNNDVINVLCVADFYCNKNHKNLISAIESINRKEIICRLTLVARDQGDCKQAVLSKITSTNFITLKESLNKQELLKEYRNADIFCMNSMFETFGLVYVEALSQQLPIIYTLQQGVDGVIPAVYGEGCLTDSLSIEKALRNQIAKIHVDVSTPVEKTFIDTYEWKKIAMKYEALY